MPALQPDHLLLVDRPFKDKARSHAVIFALWLLLLVALAVGLAGRVRTVACLPAAPAKCTWPPACPPCQLRAGCLGVVPGTKPHAAASKLPYRCCCACISAPQYKRIDDAVITFPGGCGTQLDQMICGFSTLQAVSAGKWLVPCLPGCLPACLPLACSLGSYCRFTPANAINAFLVAYQPPPLPPWTRRIHASRATP